MCGCGMRTVLTCYNYLDSRLENSSESNQGSSLVWFRFEGEAIFTYLPHLFLQLQMMNP